MTQEKEREDLSAAIREASQAAEAKALRRFDEGRRGWNDDSDMGFLLDLLAQEMRELRDAYHSRDWKNMREKCLDVINFAAFIRHCAARRGKQ